MKTRMNIRLGTWNWTRFGHLNSPQCEGWSMANGWFNRDGQAQFHFTFGIYGWTQVRVYADHLGDAFEIAVEWLDNHAPGHLTTIGDAELKEAAEELGYSWPANNSWDSDHYQEIVQHAEVDLTVIGHTTLKNGTHIASYDWTVDEL